MSKKNKNDRKANGNPHRDAVKRTQRELSKQVRRFADANGVRTHEAYELLHLDTYNLPSQS